MRIRGIVWRSELTRAATLAAVFATAGVLIGYLVMPSSPRGVDPKASVPELVLLGQRLPTGPDASEKALQIIRRYAASTITIKTPDGKRHELPRAALGAEIERVRLARLVADARDPASPLRRHFAESGAKGPITLPSPIVLNSQRGIPTLMQLKDLVDRASVDARIDLDNRKVLPEQPGIELDVFATFARLEQAMRNGETEIDAAANTVEPQLRTDKLGSISFDDTLGSFETNYARGPKHALRTYNLRLAASKLDGHIIMPGAVFDFNEVVGPRDEAHGYKDAPVIAEGELVDGTGGGTCQIAGTLHGASFFAGLKVLSRRPHTRPSSYIKMGLDAAVAYPTSTLRIRNPFDYPVVLHETVRDGIVRAEVLGPKRRLTVTFVRKILDVVPYEQVERPDPKLRAGARVLSQRGIPGFKILRYRIVRDGPFANRERSTDTYPPTTQIVRIGTSDEPDRGVEPEDDPHLEYWADEYLTMTQGPGIRTASAANEEINAGILERRVPGRTGTRGWIEKAGMPTFRSDREKNDKTCDEGAVGCAKSSESKSERAKPDDVKSDKKGAKTRKKPAQNQ